MKLEELHFRNYRLFQKLDILGLKRINLIAGKNNTGKTALLEGIRILASEGDSTVVNHILDSRGEFKPSWDSSYDALFFQGPTSSRTEAELIELSINNFGVFLDNPGKLNRDKSYRTTINSEKRHLLDADKVTDNPFDEQVVYIPYMGHISHLPKLWDNINLTHKEEDVLSILRSTILPSLKRIGHINNQFRVLLESETEPLPIGRLGDGVQRTLGIALALANAQNKILLIDEFELGLHHTIQEQLWELVFHYAEKWNIQAFITTHSEDTLQNFYYIASKEEYQKDAYFIRLQYSRKNVLEAITYDIDRLEQALQLDLEIR